MNKKSIHEREKHGGGGGGHELDRESFSIRVRVYRGRYIHDDITHTHTPRPISNAESRSSLLSVCRLVLCPYIYYHCRVAYINFYSAVGGEISIISVYYIFFLSHTHSPLSLPLYRALQEITFYILCRRIIHTQTDPSHGTRRGYCCHRWP